MKAQPLALTDPDGGFEDFGSGFLLPRGLTIVSEKKDGLPYDVEMRVLLREGRMSVESLIVRQKKGGPPVTLEHLKELPIQRMVGGVAGAHLTRVGKNAAKWDTIPQLLAEGDDADTLAHVAAIYRLSYACGLPPTQNVASVFGFSRATAGRWIARAREEGYLGPAVGPQPGEKKSPKRKGSK